MKSKLAIIIPAFIITSAFTSDDAKWSYEGKNGPSNWGELSEEFAQSTAGTRQSPIDISWHSTDMDAPIDVSYHSTSGEVLNNGHTIQVNLEGGNSFETDGNSFNLLQFHFHTPSENTINGKHYPMEMHLVHASENGTLAVLGVMFKEGEANQELGYIWDQMPEHGGETNSLNKNVKIKALLPKDHSASLFMGSLTTPPCSEGVHWNVLSTPIEASAAQIEKFEKIVGMNARPLQDINQREVRHYK